MNNKSANHRVLSSSSSIEPSRGNRSHAWVLSILMTIVVSQGCERRVDYSKIEVDERFTKNPPIATGVRSELLKKPAGGGNILFTASLPKDKIGTRTLAVMVSDSVKVVLHDDGKAGDKAADDGIYSSVLNEDLQNLNAHISRTATSYLDALKNVRDPVRFKGRSVVRLDPRMKERLISDNFLPDAFFRRRLPFDFADLVILADLLPVDPEVKTHSLLVTHPGVVGDPDRTFNPCTGVGTIGGAWTFGKLMSEMANTAETGIMASDFTLNWLNTWKSNQTINGDVVVARPNIQTIIIEDWQALSGGAGVPLDVNKAPFRLLAIVNRFDLRTSSGYGGGDAGEGRFVFCATSRLCAPRSFLVIFEYGVNKEKCSSVHKYAEEWDALKNKSLGSSEYNKALQKITDQFTLAGTNPSKPNKSSLNQIRTNEIILGSPWELREFNIDKTTSQLVTVTTKREPQTPFNGDPSPIDTDKARALGEFVNTNEASVIADKQDIPETVVIAGSPGVFLAGKAHTLNPIDFHWDGIITPTTDAGHITSDAARHHISLNTCSGCHGGETHTGNFTHIGLPIGPAGATLSKFLTGDPPFSSSFFIVSDRAQRPSPADPIQWEFNDLERRGKDLRKFLDEGCFRPFPPFPPLSVKLAFLLTFEPLTMEH